MCVCVCVGVGVGVGVGMCVGFCVCMCARVCVCVCVHCAAVCNCFSLCVDGPRHLVVAKLQPAITYMLALGEIRFWRLPARYCHRKLLCGICMTVKHGRKTCCDIYVKEGASTGI